MTPDRAPLGHAPRTRLVDLPLIGRATVSRRHDSCRAKKIFAGEPLNLSACMSGVNRMGLAKKLSAGNLHDFSPRGLARAWGERAPGSRRLALLLFAHHVPVSSLSLVRGMPSH